jgi:hypothetical protein
VGCPVKAPPFGVGKFAGCMAQKVVINQATAIHNISTVGAVLTW